MGKERPKEWPVVVYGHGVGRLYRALLQDKDGDWHVYCEVAACGHFEACEKVLKNHFWGNQHAADLYPESTIRILEVMGKCREFTLKESRVFVPNFSMEVDV